MNDHEFTEEDVQKVLKYLSIHNPKNVDRDYAIQMLERMQDQAFDIANSGLTEAEIEQALQEQSNTPEQD